MNDDWDDEAAEFREIVRAEACRLYRTDGPDIRTVAKKGGTIDEIKRLLTPALIDRLAENDLDLFVSKFGYGGNYMAPHVARRLLGIGIWKAHELPWSEPAETEAGASAREPESATSPAGNSASRNGGRPKKDFWETLIADMCGLIYRGDLKPKSVEDVVGAMQSRLIEHGLEASESSLKTRARLIRDRVLRD